MRLGHILYKLFGAAGIFFNDTCYSLKGQSDNYAIIQTAHRIEKGPTIENPRRLWGWNKVEKLVSLISKESEKANLDYFAIETGVSVLNAYKDAKEKSNDKEEFDKANSFLDKHPNVKKLVNECDKLGGAVKLNKSQVIFGGGY